MISNIHQIRVTPLTYIRSYRGYKVTITFDPDNKTWTYRAVKPVTTEIVWDGCAKSAEAAQKAAYRKIDEHG